MTMTRETGRGGVRRRRAVTALAGAAAMVASSIVTFSTASAEETGIVEYGPVPSSIPVGGVCEVEFDHNGKLWVEQYLSSQIARYDIQNDEFTNFNTPQPLEVPGGMDIDDEGNMWLPGVVSNSLIKLDTSDGSMEHIKLPWANALNTEKFELPLNAGLGLSNDVAWGADDAVWFTLGGLNSMGRYDPATGEFSKYKMPGEILGQAQALFGIIKPGPGRTVIMSAGQVNKVYMMNVDTKKVKTYTMPTPNSFPIGIRSDSKGNIWVSEGLGMKIVKIDPDTDEITEYPIYGVGGILNSVIDGLAQGTVGNPLPMPGPIAEGSDGNIYFAVSFPLATSLGNQIARFDPETHEVKTWHTPSSGSYPCDINMHQPGTLWTGLLLPNKIAKLEYANA